MTKKQVIVQIFTGGYKKITASFLEIKDAMEKLYKMSHIDAVILGWCVDKNLYRNITEYLKSRGTRSYLWLPVFSEIGLIKKAASVVDFKKRNIKNFALKDTENFEFYCPSNPQNAEAVKQIFEENFQNIDFDGVFLDKIRYPSFSNGKEGIFTCFCQECETKMLEAGIDTKSLKEKIAVVCENRSENPLGVTGYDGLSYSFYDEDMKNFFIFKKNNINQNIADLYEYFSQQGLEVGLDILAPFIGFFSGQSAKDLVEFCDFIKPMFYRATFAPAGMPFELAKYEQEFLKDPRQSSLNRILGIHEKSSEIFPMDFTTRELRDLTKLKEKHSFSIFPGFEVNRIRKIAEISPDYIKETVKEIKRYDIDGLTLSWDILSAPEENLRTVLMALFDN